MNMKWLFALMFTFVIALGQSLAWAQDVTITPIGQKTGEFCRADRP